MILSLMASSSPTEALELELGIGRMEHPLYTRVSCNDLPQHCENKTIGKIALYHTFELNDWVGLKLWLDHYSLLETTEVKPDNYGKNMAGGSLVFKLF